jgi:drug/metabolite transporter (DMT)-like permease
MTPRIKGFLFTLSAVFIFAIQDGISTHLGSHYPPVFIAMIRFWVFAGFAIALTSRSQVGFKAMAKAKRIWIQIARGVILAVHIVLSITSFSQVGLAATHTLYAGTPLVVACLSVIFLGEKIGWARAIAMGIGLIGVLLIINPLNATFNANIILPVTGVFLFSVYSVLTRLASRTDSSGTAFLYTGVVGALAISIVGPFYWTDFLPEDALLMLTLCIGSTLGHYLLIRAFDYLDAVVVQPMLYIQTVLVCLIGVLVFGEMMTMNMIIGCAIVIASGLFMIVREAMAGRRVKATDLLE